jgi:predicted transcriptional regulator
MRENSIYHITPPDMKLLDTGPVVTVLSSDDNFLDSVERMHEQLYKSVPVAIYNSNGPINDNNIAWLVSVMRLSDNVFVDLDTVSQTELVASLLNESNVIYFSENNRQPDILKLFNIREGYSVYGDMEEYAIMVTNQYV